MTSSSPSNAPPTPPPPSSDRHGRGKALKEYGRYGSVGIELVVTLLLGLWGGTQLDKRLGTTPWLTLTGMGLGAYAGFRVVWKAAKRMQADAERAAEDDRKSGKNRDGDFQ